MSVGELFSFILYSDLTSAIIALDNKNDLQM